MRRAGACTPVRTGRGLNDQALGLLALQIQRAMPPPSVLRIGGFKRHRPRDASGGSSGSGRRGAVMSLPAGMQQLEELVALVTVVLACVRELPEQGC